MPAQSVSIKNHHLARKETIDVLKERFPTGYEAKEEIRGECRAVRSSAKAGHINKGGQVAAEPKTVRSLGVVCKAIPREVSIEDHSAGAMVQQCDRKTPIYILNREILRRLVVIVKASGSNFGTK
jgi:hypothetical protein